MKWLSWFGGVWLCVGMLIGLISLPISAAAAETGLTSAYLEGYLTDAQSLFLSPLEWEQEDWLKATLVAGTTWILMQNDEEIQDYFQEERSNFSDDLAQLLENFGDPKVLIPALVLFYGYGKSTGDSRAQTAALYSLEGVTIAGGLTCGIKVLTHRARPYTGNGSAEWGGLSSSLSDKNLSFPSFHATAAFATAKVFATVYEDITWVPYMAYSLATGVALSRVNDNVHWSSDVFLGSVLGWYTAKTIMNNHLGEAKSALTLLPFGTKTGWGLAVNYRY